MAIFRDLKTFSLLRPDIIKVPSSIASGLSCVSLIVIAENLNIDDSSEIVPESEIVQAASF